MAITFLNAEEAMELIDSDRTIATSGFVGNGVPEELELFLEKRFLDTGHIYHRKWEQTYKSTIFEWTENRTEGNLEFNADVPGNSELQFYIRSAVNPERISERSWHRLTDQSFRINQEDRTLQYKAVFISDNGDRYPVLDQVEISVQ